VVPDLQKIPLKEGWIWHSEIIDSAGTGPIPKGEEKKASQGPDGASCRLRILIDGLSGRHCPLASGSALIGHSIRDYDTPSLYRRSYAFMVNNSLIFVVVIAALYRLVVR